MKKLLIRTIILSSFIDKVCTNNTNSDITESGLGDVLSSSINPPDIFDKEPSKYISKPKHNFKKR